MGYLIEEWREINSKKGKGKNTGTGFKKHKYKKINILCKEMK